MTSAHGHRQRSSSGLVSIDLKSHGAHGQTSFLCGRQDTCLKPSSQPLLGLRCNCKISFSPLPRLRLSQDPAKTFVQRLPFQGHRRQVPSRPGLLSPQRKREHTPVSPLCPGERLLCGRNHGDSVLSLGGTELQRLLYEATVIMRGESF